MPDHRRVIKRGRHTWEGNSLTLTIVERDGTQPPQVLSVYMQLAPNDPDMVEYDRSLERLEQLANRAERELGRRPAIVPGAKPAYINWYIVAEEGISGDDLDTAIWDAQRSLQERGEVEFEE